MEDMANNLIQWVMNAGIKVVIALIVLLIGFKIVNSIFKKLETANAKSGKIDASAFSTIAYVGKLLLKIVIVVCLISYLGINTTAVSALIASLGVAVGFALNGTVSNFAGGILLLFTRPFKVGDFVDLAGYTGTVEEIHIVYTKLATIDNRVVSIPNGTASTTNVVNYSVKELRRVDHTFTVAQNTDWEKAMECIKSVIAACPTVEQEADNMVRVISNTGAGIEITCRAWCKNADYWETYFSLNEAVKKAFANAGIGLPHQQLDVHMQEK